MSLTRGSVFRIPGPLTLRPRGQWRCNICQNTRIRSRKATTKLCCLKTTTRDLKDRNTTAVVHSNTLHILNFPLPPKRGKECSTTYCNVYGSALLLMQALAAMCTAVRWCCCRLFLLSRHYPHGEHHARDITNTPETHQFVGTSSDTIRTQVTCHIGTKQTQSTP